MLRPLLIKTLTFRAAIIVIDYAVLALVLQRPLEAGFITIIRQTFHTFLYWGHEIAWAHRHLDAQVPGQAVPRRRTFKKTISFRAISFPADFLLLWLVSGSIGTSGAGAVLIGITNTIFFYYHDRWWEAWRAAHTPAQPPDASNT